MDDTRIEDAFSLLSEAAKGLNDRATPFCVISSGESAGANLVLYNWVKLTPQDAARRLRAAADKLDPKA